MLRLPKLTGRLSVGVHRIPTNRTEWLLRRHSSSGPTPIPRSRSPILAFALGALVSGAVAFAITGGRSTTPLDELTRLSSFPADTDSGLNEQYGSAADFQKAIGELRATFPKEDVVSTDVEVLELHGNSDNDYHPGES